MFKLIFFFFTVLLLTLFQQPKTLKGNWEYSGGKFNNKIDHAPKGYKQLRKYTDNKFEAFLIEKGQKTIKYETGNYTLKGDTCFETQTFSSQPSQLLNIKMRYVYQVRHDTLFLRAQLPNGSVEEDCWKRVK